VNPLVLQLALQTAVLGGAFLADRFAGEPANRLHPVAWMGLFITRLWNHRPPAPAAPAPLFLFGAFITLSGAALFSFPLYLLFALLPESGIFLLITLFLSVLLLDLSFSLRKLFSVGLEIARALEEGELEQARQLTSFHLVSRPTDGLDESRVAAAVVESIAENLTDSFVSPLFFYCLAGLPGAWAYRYINTCDAMIGYRKGDFLWGGKFAARLDDVLNYLPARIAALVLLAAAGGGHVREVLSCRKVTESPNAGWTMAAVALSLGLRLEKEGCYTINPEGRTPGAQDIRTAVALVHRASLLLLPLFILSAFAMRVVLYG
jgi:adenosylcobinamide-phosphate synthase